MTNRVQIVNPSHFAEPKGYSNGVVTTGRTLHVAGQVGWEADHTFASDDFADQFARALDNVIDVVKAAGGRATDLARMTIYVTSVDEYRGAVKRLGPIWRERLGKHYPAMALVGVAALVEPGAKLEIEAVAALPELDQ